MSRLGDNGRLARDWTRQAWETNLTLLEGRPGRVAHLMAVTTGFTMLLGGLILGSSLQATFPYFWISILGIAVLLTTPVISKAELGLIPRRPSRQVGYHDNIGTFRGMLNRSRPPLDEVVLFAFMLAAPQQIVSRIREYITPLTRALHVRVAMTIGPLPGKGSEVYFPVHVLRKGRLVDDLRVLGEDGRQLPLVSYSEGVTFAMMCLRRLIQEGARLPIEFYRAEFEKRVYASLSRRAPLSKKERRVVSRLVVDLGGALGESPYTDTILYLVEMLSSHYCQFVSIPAASGGERQQTLTIEYRRLHDLEGARGGPAAVLGRFRTALGVRPNTYVISLQNAARCSSYHLEFMGPPGSYLARQELVGHRTVTRTSSDGTSSQVRENVPFGVSRHGKYRRNRRRRGQRYAHIYIRGGTKNIQRDSMSVVLSFFERSPGSAGEAAVASLASTSLILGGGWVLSRPGNPTGDLMAVLLAFPVVASSWLGLQREPGVAGGVMSARLGNLATFVLSLVAAISALGVSIPLKFYSDWKFMGSRAGWAILAILASTATTALLISWLRRSMLYSEVLERSDSSDEHSFPL